MSLFFWKKREPGHSFNQEDRELSAEIRKGKAEIMKQKQQLELELMRLKVQKEKEELLLQIAQTKDAMSEFMEEEEPLNPDSSMQDTLMLTLLGKFLGNNSTPPQTLPQPQEAPIQKIHLSDEQLKEIYEKVPRSARKIAKSFSEEQLQTYIRSYIPTIDQESLERAVIIVKQ